MDFTYQDTVLKQHLTSFLAKDPCLQDDHLNTWCHSLVGSCSGESSRMQWNKPWPQACKATCDPGPVPLPIPSPLPSPLFLYLLDEMASEQVCSALPALTCHVASHFLCQSPDSLTAFGEHRCFTDIMGSGSLSFWILDPTCESHGNYRSSSQ